MPKLDAAFAALADPTRRAILARLALGEATVMELAEPFEMTQPAISHHLKVLEGAGLIGRRVDGTRRPAGWHRPVSTQSINGLRCCGTLGRELRPAGCGSGRHETRGAKGHAMSKMTIKTEGDTHVIVTRLFAASPRPSTAPTPSQA